MKQTYLAILGLLLVAGTSQAALITVTGAANSTTRGTADLGSVLTTTLVTDNTAPPQALAVTVSGLNVDGIGGDNDSVVLAFTVTTDGQNIQTSGTTQAGWLSSGGVTLNANGEFVQVDYAGMSVDLNGLAGSGNGTSGESFLGFTGVGLGSWAANHVAVVNGISQAYVDGTADKHIALPNDPSIKSWFDTAANTGAALDSAGSWRPENFDFQFEVNTIPEPTSLGLMAALGGAIFFIRRRRRV